MITSYLFDPLNEITILNEASIYPGTNNAHDVEIKFPDGKKFINHLVPKEEYELAQILKFTLTKDQIIIILPKLNDYASYCFNDGVFSESMNGDESL